ncbi:MAG: transcription elongation factor Spt5 [Nitrososphaeria archaeon]
MENQFFAVRTTGGQEDNVADFIYKNAIFNKNEIYCIIHIPSQKGYLIIEAKSGQDVREAISGVKHIKELVPGLLKLEDFDKLLIKKPAIAEFTIGEVVDIVMGPFKGMRAKITKIDLTKMEVTVMLLDAPYPLTLTVEASYLKPTKKG